MLYNQFFKKENLSVGNFFKKNPKQIKAKQNKN